MAFYINKIKVIGVNKETIELNFNMYLNVISGSSDTGKSYILDLINYMFGSKDKIRELKESKGYTKIRIEIKSYSGDFIYTIQRDFDSKIILVSNSKEEIFDDVEKEKYIAGGKDNKNLSCLILKLLNLNNKKLIINKSGKRGNLSFRDILKTYILVNEKKIIDTVSPILTGQYICKTKEQSVFKLLITGKDDDEIEEFEDIQTIKNIIKGKIEYVTEILGKKNKQILNLNLEIEQINLDELNIQINELSNELNAVNFSVLAQEKKRNSFWNNLNQIDSEITQHQELRYRFELLNEHYLSDLERLNFINESKQLIDQLKTVDCPICGHLIEYNILGKYDDSEDNKILSALEREYYKINKKQIGLKTTLDNLNMDLELKIKERAKLKEELEKIEEYIKNKLKPIYDVNFNKLNKILKSKQNISLVNELIIEVKDLEKDLENLHQKSKEKVEKKEIKQENYITHKQYEILSIKIKEILNSWNINHNIITFDRDLNDIVLDGKNRSEFGKGFRAIYYSAFMIAVTLYLFDNNFEYYSFLLLDSPITSYKKKDEPLKDEDKIPETTEKLFYNSINNLIKNKKIQIIIVENKDPPADLQENIKYWHFTKNETFGRYGFYPKLK